MKSIRTRLVIAIAGSAVLAGGLSAAAVAASQAASAAVQASSTSYNPNVTLTDP